MVQFADLVGRPPLMVTGSYNQNLALVNHARMAPGRVELTPRATRNESNISKWCGSSPRQSGVDKGPCTKHTPREGKLVTS